MLTGGLRLSGPLIVIWVTPAVVALVVAFATRNMRAHVRHQVLTTMRFLALGYVAAAVVLTLWPLEADVSITRVEEGNWTPFEGTLGFLISNSPAQRQVAVGDVVANLVLFAPLGLLLPWIVPRRGAVFASLFTIAVLAFGLEIAQGITIAQRTFDIDDAIAGFAGSVVPVLGAVLIRPARPG